jgi:hypothetical protein
MQSVYNPLFGHPDPAPMPPSARAWSVSMHSSGSCRIRATTAALADPAHGTGDDPALRYGGHTELDAGRRNLRPHGHATVRSGGRLLSHAADQHAPNLRQLKRPFETRG